MVFSSVVFLSVFLPLFLVIYNLSSDVKIKNLILTVFSLFFYAWGEPVWIIALIFSGTIDYIHGRIINIWFGKWQAKAALVSSLVLNLGILFLFKYSSFFIDTLNSALGTSIHFMHFNLPLGISFYTFQTLSYTIDVYRGEVKYQKSFVGFMAYVSMFPQLVAGPIVRYSDIEGRLDKRTVTITSFSDGVSRFAVGLSKKVLLANNAGKVATMFLDGGVTSLSTAGAWMGVIMFAFQIYFDFSGYSDMAIGLGKMIGFDFKENFDYPYTSKSITEFWRKWHISLGSFFRDYIYIPLGGNRRYLIRNIIVVWFLTGLWHGASWNFILWGVYYGVILLIEKLVLKKFLNRLPSPILHLYSLFFILIGWAMFYYTDISQLFAVLKIMFGQGGNMSDYMITSTLYGNIFLLPVLIIAATPIPKKLFILAKQQGLGTVEPILTGILTLVSFIAILGQTYNPFLYFRF